MCKHKNNTFILTAYLKRLEVEDIITSDTGDYTEKCGRGLF